MSQEKRIELIKQLLEERQELSTKDIMEEFGVSRGYCTSGHSAFNEAR